jgi:CRISPR-associated endonuclease Csn1
MKNNLISEEKYKRLVRNTTFTDEEKTGFINRQLVETRQSTKALATILKMKYPEAEIVYSKAGLVSDFRHEFGMLKSRSVNDLHHAKDAYLNIVVGNVYHCRFTKKFYVEQKYSLKTKTIFSHDVKDGDKIVWDGKNSIENVRRTMMKNNIRCTKYAFIKKGGFFDQNPLKATSGLAPRKAGLDVERYGGYDNSTAPAFILVTYMDKGKKEAMIMPIESRFFDKFFVDEEYAQNYTKNTLEKVWGRENGQITGICFPMGMKPLKINTVFSFDGFRACIIKKANKSKIIGLSSMMPLVVGESWEKYVKKLEAFIGKKENNENLKLDENYDGISREKNEQLYEILLDKIENHLYSIPFSAQITVLKDGFHKFKNLDTENQVKVLNQIVLLLKTGRASSCNFKLVNGSPNAGAFTESSKISNWQKQFSDVRIINVSASGIYESCSGNLLDLLK